MQQPETPAQIAERRRLRDLKEPPRPSDPWTALPPEEREGVKTMPLADTRQGGGGGR